MKYWVSCSIRARVACSNSDTDCISTLESRLLALGQQCLQQGDTDGAAEVPHHVEQARCRTGVLRLDTAVATAESGRAPRLADGVNHVRPEQLIGAVIRGHVDIHEVERWRTAQSRHRSRGGDRSASSAGAPAGSIPVGAVRSRPAPYRSARHCSPGSVTGRPAG